MMEIERTAERVSVRALNSGADNLVLARDVAGFVAFLFSVLLALHYGWPYVFGIPGADLELLPLAQAFAAVFGLIAGALVVGAPFDTGYECTFDLVARRCTWRRILRLRALGLDLRGRETIDIASITGIGLREVSDESGFVYRPVLVVGRRELRLSSHSGSYLGLNQKLDEVRAVTGLAKLDVPRPVDNDPKHDDLALH